jgi:excisionase family DNA binding protein
MSAAALTDPVSIPQSEEEQVKQLYRLMLQGRAALVGPEGDSHDIPQHLYQLLLRILNLLREGKAISVVPYMQELTTQEAANAIGMSRQFLVRLLEDGKIPFHRVGTHRRIYLKDLLEFRKKRDTSRRALLDEIVERDREDGLYDKVVQPDE